MITVTIDIKEKEALKKVCATGDIKFFFHEYEFGNSIKVTFEAVSPAMAFYLGRMIETQLSMNQLVGRI